ncbi:MAG: hypothetical protein PSW75_01045, partial [bacterium]|nr:hypothetical protein [bacterium]
LLWPAVLLSALAVSVEAALAAGGSAYTKRFKTVLLAEPSPLAAPAGELALGRKLTVREARGSWLLVSDGPATGWVFAGNLSETKPEETKGADGLPLAASQTTATAAARPLTPAAADYAERRNLGSAREDLDWLLAECKAFTPADVTAFLQAQKKGEHQ